MAVRRKKVSNFRILENYSHFVPGGSGVLGLCFWLIVGVLLGNLASLLFVKALGIGNSLDATMIISYPLMFIPAMIYASSRNFRGEEFDKGYRLDSSHFKPVGGALCALYAILATLALNFVADYFINLLPPMPPYLEEVLKNMTQGNFWINLLCVSVFAPFFEEWLCRGMVLRGLLYHRRSNGKTMSPVWAIVISAAFFAIIHANPWQAIAAFLLGCLFGFVYWKTGSLKLTMLMHCANNSFALILGQIPSLKEMNDWRELFDGPEYWLIFASCLLAVALVIYEFNKIGNSRQGNCDEVPALFDQEL